MIDIIHTVSKGRCVVAKMPIPAGTVILEEDPLVCVPSSSSTLKGLLEASGAHQLSPVELSLHAAAASRGNKKGFPSALLAARLLVMLRRPGAGQPLQAAYRQLVCHAPGDPKWLEGLEASAAIVQRLVAFQLSAYAVSLDECKEALCKLSCNAFTVTSETITCGIGLYMAASAVNHSCDPNCLQSFGFAGRLTVRAVRLIPAGQEVCISYIDLGLPRGWREKELAGYGFLCHCSRCTTEGQEEGAQCKECGEVLGKMAYQQWLSGLPSGGQKDMCRSCGAKQQRS